MLTLVPPGFSPKHPEPENHCAPCLDLFELHKSGGTHTLVATPFLNPFEMRRFKTFHDFNNFFSEICKGIEFMHRRNIAYRACTVKNIVWTNPPLVIPDNGTPHHHRYYFLDFGFSREYQTRDEEDEQLGGNPFRHDVYNVGSLVSEKFVNKFHGFHPIRDLVEHMTIQKECCPPIEWVLDEFERIRSELGTEEPRLLSTSLWHRVFGGWWDK
ncbi:hypothetical protein BGW80DRAFT_1341258 [Lactifluus volemus]|nr:hypothetical protein BGW80DRAFT_1341258 [Lactifluus volemus]